MDRAGPPTRAERTVGVIDGFTVDAPRAHATAAAEQPAARARRRRTIRRNPEATDEGFDEQGYWRTGDLVRLLPSGDIQFVSRLKDMLRVGGENVAAAEIERVLVDHPAVAAAGVVAHPDPVREQVAVAFVVAPGADADIEAELIAHCAERLADFEVPRRVHVIDELPESLIGKVSKKILQQRAIELGLSD